MRFSVVADARCDTMSRMSRRRIGFLSVGVAILFVVAFLAPGIAAAQAGSASALAGKLRAQRTSATDLEIGGDLPGLPAGTTRYLTREDLLAAAHPMAYRPDDGSFPVLAQIIGVPIDDLVSALGVPASDMVIAICKDKYRAHYPHAYLAAHHPVLVMELYGKSHLDWLKGAAGDDAGPYLIAHLDFTPAFKILAHKDEPQIPWGVIRLEFRDERAVFGAIAPRGAQADHAAVQDGFKIAQQNCFRCHNNGAEGGLKSGVTWTVLAALAANSPQFFTEYVRDPKAKNPKTQMAASPAYDDATMRALIAYFRTFASISPEAR
ncbi:MAG: cytochrome c [Candidatus Acidiferrales bacterium]